MAICFYLLTSCQFSFANQLYQFDIKPQRADRAIIEFAQQTDQTIIFSFELTKNFQTNELKGFYPADFAIQKLLKLSGLTAIFSPSGQLIIERENKKASKISPSDTITDDEQSLIALAQSINSQSEQIEKIFITGSRVSGRLVEDLPVPVDVISAQAIENSGHTEVGRVLQTLAPSFNFSSSAISDGTDVVRPATLRGLGPDQTLVLVNGRRRHQASLIHINTSVGRGTAGTDMNAIPVASIKRIEVLRDGASAQYGSDAIAGVINIILKDDDQGGKASLTYGQYAQGDGETTSLDISKGFSLEDKGFVSATFSLRDLGYTNRAGLNGACQYTGCTQLPNGNFLVGDPREITSKRDNFQIGDPDSQQIAAVVNAGYEIGQGELYGFATYSHRKNQSASFFRANNNIQNNALLLDGDATVPDGFLPKINSTISDYSYNLGYQTEFSSDETLNLSYTYGKNTIDYTTIDTINSSYANSLQYNQGLSPDSIRATIPREALSYGLELSLQTFNLDFTKTFDHFSLALGSELRSDKYKISAGDEYSYRDYDTVNGVSLYEYDRTPGTQGFGGISPDFEVNESRDIFSFYADIESELTDNFLINAAARYDNYKGFNGSTNYKLAAHWNLSEVFEIRSAVSTGFRAPSMQQLFFNNISTQYISKPETEGSNQTPAQVHTLNNNNPLAQSIGFKRLKEESATNFSFGTIFNFTSNFNLTIDWYAINIDDRIVISNKITRGISSQLTDSLHKYNTEAAQFFLNGADTETKGIDLITTWNTRAFNGDLSFTLAANVTDTKVVNLSIPEDIMVKKVDTKDIFSAQDISIIEDWQPRNRISLNTFYQVNHWSINLVFNRIGEYKITDGGEQTYGAEILTDLHINYEFDNGVALIFGSNNLFDVYPDKNKIGNANAGTIEDNNGNILVDSQGVFTYSRRSAPFGFNGAFYYAGVEYNFF